MRQPRYIRGLAVAGVLLSACGGGAYSPPAAQSGASATTAAGKAAAIKRSSTIGIAGSMIVNTNAVSGWVVEPPGSSGFISAVLTCQDEFWAGPIGKSQWIAADSNSCGGRQPGGYYVYQYTFCPAYVSSKPFLILNVLADNAFDVNLNGSDFDPYPFQNYGSLQPFEIPQIVSTHTGFSTTSKNVLQIIVENQDSSPTGLDAAGYVSNIEPSC